MKNDKEEVILRDEPIIIKYSIFQDNYLKIINKMLKDPERNNKESSKNNRFKQYGKKDNENKKAIAEPKLRNVFLMNLWGVCIAMGSLISGYLFVIVSVLSSSMTEYVQQQGYFDINMQLYISICTTSLSIGGLIGTLLYPRLIEFFNGQNRLLASCDFVLIALTIIQLFNLDIYQHTITRFFQGFVVGIYGIVIPTYLMSIAPTKMSGQLGSLNQIMVTIGIAIGYCMGYLIDQNDLSNVYNWRICILLPIPTCIIGLFIGQTFPMDTVQRHIQRRQWQILLEYINRFYQPGTFSIEDLIISKNLKPEKYGRIPKNLQSFRKQKKIDDSNIQIASNSQVQGTEYSIDNEQSSIQQQRETDGFKLRRNVSLMLSFVSQFCGINAIIFYANQLFLDISKGDAKYAVNKSVQLGFFQIFITLVSGGFMDQFGRKSLLLFGSFMIIFSLLGAYYMLQFDLQGHWDPSYISYAIFLHIFGFSLSYGPITVLYMSQILQDISGYMTLLWIQTIIISLTSNIMMKQIGTGKTFFIYGIITIVGAIYLKKYMLQTKGFTRKQIVANFQTFCRTEQTNVNFSRIYQSEEQQTGQLKQ